MRRDRIITSILARCAWDGDCLEWRAGINSGGHPVMRHDGKPGLLARRVLVEAQRGEAIPPGMLVRPICANKLCMNRDHFKLWTRQESCAHTGKLGNLGRPDKRITQHLSAHKKLTAEAVRQILVSPETGLALAERFGVCHTTISAVRRGKLWRAANPMAGLL